MDKPSKVTAFNIAEFAHMVKPLQSDPLSTLLACAGIPLDRPLGIATKQLTKIGTGG